MTETEHGFLLTNRRPSIALREVREAISATSAKFGVETTAVVVDIAKGRALGGIAAVGTAESLAAWPVQSDEPE